jgi:REP element-mobilizing transposase RayT
VGCERVMMDSSKYNSDLHHRRSIRLQDYDYSQEGLYFITICCYDKECLFGEIVNGQVVLNNEGKIAYNEWNRTPEIRKNVSLGEFVIMPNHIHGIITINYIDILHTPKNQQNTDMFRDVLHTPKNQQNTDMCRGVLHTPKNQQNPDVRRGVLHTPKNQQNPDVRRGVLHTPKNIGNISNINIISNLTKQEGVCNTPLQSPSQTIGAIVRGYKSSVTKQINSIRSGTNRQIWQRNYWEHVIRNEKSYYKIAEYIINNPSKWDEDSLNPEYNGIK